MLYVLETALTGLLVVVETQIEEVLNAITQAKDEVHQAKRIRRNRQGDSKAHISLVTLLFTSLLYIILLFKYSVKLLSVTIHFGMFCGLVVVSSVQECCNFVVSTRLV